MHIDIEDNSPGRFFVVYGTKEAGIMGKYGYCRRGISVSTDDEFHFLFVLSGELCELYAVGNNTVDK